MSRCVNEIKKIPARSFFDEFLTGLNNKDPVTMGLLSYFKDIIFEWKIFKFPKKPFISFLEALVNDLEKGSITIASMSCLEKLFEDNSLDIGFYTNFLHTLLRDVNKINSVTMSYMRFCSALISNVNIRKHSNIMAQITFLEIRVNCVNKMDPAIISKMTFIEAFENGVDKETHETMIDIFYLLFWEQNSIKICRDKTLKIIKEQEYDFTNIVTHISCKFKY